MKAQNRKWRVFPIGDTAKQRRPDDLVRLLFKLAPHQYPKIAFFEKCSLAKCPEQRSLS